MSFGPENDSLRPASCPLFSFSQREKKRKMDKRQAVGNRFSVMSIQSRVSFSLIPIRKRKEDWFAHDMERVRAQALDLEPFPTDTCGRRCFLATCLSGERKEKEISG